MQCIRLDAPLWVQLFSTLTTGDQVVFVILESVWVLITIISILMKYPDKADSSARGRRKAAGLQLWRRPSCRGWWLWHARFFLFLISSLMHCMNEHAIRFGCFPASRLTRKNQFIHNHAKFRIEKQKPVGTLLSAWTVRQVLTVISDVPDRH